jgi:hypothetical protein
VSDITPRSGRLASDGRSLRRRLDLARPKRGHGSYGGQDQIGGWGSHGQGGRADGRLRLWHRWPQRGITSGLAGVGAAVGGGMVAGTSIVVAAPAVAALAC